MSKQMFHIDWTALEVAFERNSPASVSFLDRMSGSLVSHSLEAIEALENRLDLIRVEPASSRQQYGWMEEFISSVDHSMLRHQLQVAVDGKGAFRRFKDALLAYPKERERWFCYRIGKVHWLMQAWLEANEILAVPPWGKVSPPQALTSAPVAAAAPLVVPVGAKVESLRIAAKLAIDGLSVSKLTSALEYLEFLRKREQGSASFGVAGLPTEKKSQAEPGN